MIEAERMRQTAPMSVGSVTNFLILFFMIDSPFLFFSLEVFCLSDVSIARHLSQKCHRAERVDFTLFENLNASKSGGRCKSGHEGAFSTAPIQKRTPSRSGGRLKVIHGFLRSLCRCCDTFLLPDLFEEMSDHYRDDCDGAASNPHFYVCE